MQRTNLDDKLEIQVTPSGETILPEKAISLPFFVGEKNNSKLYILGTHHHLPLSSLQKSVLPYINEAKFALFEDTRQNLLPLKKLYEIGFLTHAENDKWYEALSEEALNNLKYLVTRFFHEGLNKDPVPLKYIHPGLVIYMCFLARRPKNCMDKELIKIFKDKSDSLEGLERWDFFKSQPQISITQLQDFLISPQTIDLNQKYPFLLRVAKRNFKWMHKIIEASTHSKTPILVAVGAAHLEGASGLISLLHRFGYEFSIIQDDSLQKYVVPTSEDNGNRLLEQIDSTISNQLKHTFFSLVPSVSSVNIISNYLSFSIFPEHSKTLSEEIQIFGDEYFPIISFSPD